MSVYRTNGPLVINSDDRWSRHFHKKSLKFDPLCHTFAAFFFLNHTGAISTSAEFLYFIFDELAVRKQYRALLFAYVT